MKVVIVGEGPTLYFVGKLFNAKGHTVTMIVNDPPEAILLARKLKATIIQGDGSDPNVLQDAEVSAADALLAITPKDQDNLVICQLASLQFGVHRTLALVNDPENAEIFQQLGVRSFSSTTLIASLIEERTSLADITNLVPLDEGRVIITELVINQDYPVAGKLLKEIHLPDNALIAVLIRAGSAIIPRGNNQILPGDRIVVISLPENHGVVLRALSGDHS